MDLANKAAELLEDMQGENLCILDVRGKSSVTDFYLLVTGNSPPHLKAMFNDVQHDLKQMGVHAYRRSGTPEAGWMALDYVDVIIHILTQKTREYYAFEDLWSEAKPLPTPQD